jgi:hypothetical protein
MIQCKWSSMLSALLTGMMVLAASFPWLPSDLLALADTMPKLCTNVADLEGPPSVQPAPTQPGLPPPPMPQPAEPGLKPPPMPQPAEPPPLSRRPDLNPSVPGAPEQEPSAPTPTPEPEPTASEQTT